MVPFDFAGDDLARSVGLVCGAPQAEKLWFIRARLPAMISACARITG